MQNAARMPSLLLILALAVGAAWLAARPVGGAWFTQLVATGPALAPVVLAGGWTVAFLAQALAAWLAWRMAGRHAATLLAGSALALGSWAAWSWTLLHWHRPGWSLGVLALAGLLQLYLLFVARGLGAATLAALLPPAAWLAGLGWLNLAWWRAAGGGLGSITG